MSRLVAQQALLPVISRLPAFNSGNVMEIFCSASLSQTAYRSQITAGSARIGRAGRSVRALMTALAVLSSSSVLASPVGRGDDISTHVPPSSHGTQPGGIRIDAEAARRTIDAALNLKLTREEALAVADLEGNKGLIQQAREFGLPETRDTFADALVAAAHGSSVQTIYNFQEVRANAASARAALAALAADPRALDRWITDRIAPFVPVGIPLAGVGYVVAGGPGAGYSTDDGEVYINISREKGEMGVIRVDFSHEFYHHIQHVAQVRAGSLKDFKFDQAIYDALPSAIAKRCYATRQLFGKLMVEGTASYVGDIGLFPASGEEALSVRSQREASLLGKVDRSISLLDIGLTAMTADDPVSEKSVYGMGFLYAGQLYYDLGYVMAKAIARHDGDAEIGHLLAEPGDAFVRRYVALTREPGSNLPKLGAHAQEWAARNACR